MMTWLRTWFPDRRRQITPPPYLYPKFPLISDEVMRLTFQQYAETPYAELRASAARVVAELVEAGLTMPVATGLLGVMMNSARRREEDGGD